MKTKKELVIIKEEYETIGNKLAELNEEELKQVVGSGPKIISPILRQLMSETGKTWTFDIGVTDPPVSGGQHQR